MSALRALVSADAWERWGDRLLAAGPDLAWDAMAVDGTTSTVAGTPAAPAPPDVAWLSNDVFYSGVLGAFLDALRAAPDLAWVQSAAAGTDSPMFREIIERGVRFTTSHVSDIPIAEYVLGSVLRCYQQPERWARAAAERAWRHHDFREVHGSTWLVVGVGAIGREVAVRARAFGATVVGVRRTPTGDEPVDEMIAPDEVPGALPGADVVVLALPATGGPPLVDAPFLGAMAEGSVLVNVARGSVVDEAALVAALDAGRPGHAVLDVAATEPPPPDSPLWSHPGITLTPHNAAGGLGRFARAADVFAANLARFQAGEPLDNEVRP